MTTIDALLPEGWSLRTRMGPRAGYEIIHEGRTIGCAVGDGLSWQIAVTDRRELSSLLAQLAVAGGAPVVAEVEGQALGWGALREIVIGSIALSVVLGDPGSIRIDNGKIVLVDLKEAGASEAIVSYELITNFNPTIASHRAGPVLAQGAVGKTAILVVSQKKGFAHGDLPVQIDRVDRSGHPTRFVGHVVAPDARLPPDMQRQLRKDWYPAPGVVIEFSATDVRDVLELRVADLPPELRPR